MSHRLLSDFKNFIEYGNSDTEYDEIFSLVLESAESFIENLCNMKIEQESLTYTFNGDGTDTIRLPYTPIASIDTIVVSNDTKDVSDYYTNGSFLVDMVNTFTTGTQNVVITYTVGYLDADIPAPIKTSMFRIADKIYKDMSQNRDGVASFDSQTKVGVDFVKQDLPEGVLLFLQPYRNIVV